MKTILDHPLFRLVPARGPLMYANVSNALEVSLAEKTVSHYVEVGTNLFHLMQKLKVSPESKVLLFLDVIGRSAYFGIMVDEVDLFDLWSIPFNSLPDWLGDESHWSLAPSSANG